MVVLLAALVLTAACASARIGDDAAPKIMYAVWDLEVPVAGVEATLIVHDPVDLIVRDTILASGGDVYECVPLLRTGSTRCGPFALQMTNDGIIGTYEYCHSTEVPVTRTVTDLTTGVSRQVTVRETDTDCSDVPVTAERRTLERERTRETAGAWLPPTQPDNVSGSIRGYRWPIQISGEIER